MSSAEEPGISDISEQLTSLQLTPGISRFIAVNLCILSNAVTYLKEQPAVATSSKSTEILGNYFMLVYLS